jgi:hypothetical protein
VTNESKPALPPNPFRRQPVKDRARLAGRARELERMEYYLRLTRAGQSPHIALIGTRGVGKTSLLNAGESIATSLGLLPVRVDLNESLVQSQGAFWHELYTSLILAACKAGCWDGVSGPIYASLFKMLHTAEPVDVARAVLQLPVIFSAHHGTLDGVACSEALICHDLGSIQEELRRNGRCGIAILIDEADCLGLNRPLLQILRNVFQRVDGASLVLAGTEEVFPLLSQIFSPIPRQFHRIEVVPFVSVFDTLAVTQAPELEPFGGIAPEWDTVGELHAISGGDPSELQLYCHHMYALVEEGLVTRMALHPEVFHRVLHEYRAMQSSHTVDVIRAIERLPDRLLFESRWLQRQGVLCSENVKLRLIARALQDGTIDSGHGDIEQEVRAAYSELYNIGIISFEDRIRLKGEPLTTGFWKSFVKSSKQKPWQWRSGSFLEELLDTIVGHMSHEFGGDGLGGEGIVQGRLDDGAMSRVRALVEGGGAFDRGMLKDLMAFTHDLVTAARMRYRRSIRFELKVSAAGGEITELYYYYSNRDPSEAIESLRRWIDKRLPWLGHHGVSLDISRISSWNVPRASEVKVHENVTTHLLDLAIDMERVFDEMWTMPSGQQLYREGNYRGAADAFREVLAKEYDAVIESNLAYCLMLLGDIPEAGRHLDNAIGHSKNPIIGNNVGVVAAISGDILRARTVLADALEWFDLLPSEAKQNRPLCMAILQPDCKGFESRDEVPTDVAILVNLVVLGQRTREDGIRELSVRYPTQVDQWRGWFPP